MKQVTTLIFTLSALVVMAQEAPKVVLITLDGYRWQELFQGADPELIGNKDYVRSPEFMKHDYWQETPEARRKTLMPFIWTEVEKMGQLHGNRNLGSKVNLTNTLWFSYPGYNEILTGRADDERISSNDKIPNPNATVLELANRHPDYQGRVVAFGSWDVFPYIINEERSGVRVNAGYENAEGALSEREKQLNDMQRQAPIIWESVRLDVFTHQFALETMKKDHPRVIYIAYGETDDFAHDGHYDFYLQAAHRTDGMIRELWDFTRQDPFYRDNTLFLITTDHGRGIRPLEDWRSHGSEVAGADQVWLIAFGQGVAPIGEVKGIEQLYSNQIAPTLAQFLGIDLDGVPMELQGNR